MKNKKEYMKEYMKTYMLTPKGFLTKQYARCKERNLVGCTKKEFIEFSLQDKNFQYLFTQYKKLKKWGRDELAHWQKPSPDRIDEYKPYSINNIQWITWKANKQKAITEMKNIKSYTKTFSHYCKLKQYYVIVEKKDKNFFMIFTSLNDIISCFPFMLKSKICLVINKKRKHHHGFTFKKYKGVVAR